MNLLVGRFATHLFSMAHRLTDRDSRFLIPTTAIAENAAAVAADDEPYYVYRRIACGPKENMLSILPVSHEIINYLCIRTHPVTLGNCATSFSSHFEHTQNSTFDWFRPPIWKQQNSFFIIYSFMQRERERRTWSVDSHKLNKLCAIIITISLRYYRWVGLPTNTIQFKLSGCVHHRRWLECCVAGIDSKIVVKVTFRH